MRRSFAPLALLLLTPTPALAVNVAFELSPGVAFPIGSFIDDFPLPVDDVTPFLRAFGFPVVWAPDDPNYQETAGAVRLDATSDPGFAIGLGVLLDNWELRYNLQVHSWGELSLNGYNLRLGAPVEFLDNVFFDVEAPQAPFVFKDAGDDLDLAPLIVHRITAGYRFYVLDYWDIKPFIPVALGFVVMHGDDFDTILGGSIELGLGLEYRFDDHWGLSLSWRYIASIMENPAIKVSGLEGQAIQAGTGGEGLFETAIEIFQAVTLNANAIYRF
ncbi:MAG: hypothetical protein AMXMBFR64_59410 [Myxococcales bacterium]